MEKNDFLEMNKKHMESLGFWEEQDKWMTISGMMMCYNKEIIREWHIVDFTVTTDKTLLKWAKRHRLLTDKELKDKYGV